MKISRIIIIILSVLMVAFSTAVYVLKLHEIRHEVPHIVKNMEKNLPPEGYSDKGMRSYLDVEVKDTFGEDYVQLAFDDVYTFGNDSNPVDGQAAVYTVTLASGKKLMAAQGGVFTQKNYYVEDKHMTPEEFAKYTIYVNSVLTEAQNPTFKGMTQEFATLMSVPEEWRGDEKLMLKK